MATGILPPRTPIADRSGLVTPEWYRYFVGNKSDTDTALGSAYSAGEGLAVSGGSILIKDGGVTDSKIRNGVATSVIGRFASTPGRVADILASNDRQVLTRQGGVLAFFDYLDLFSIIAGQLTIGTRSVTSDTTYADGEMMIAADASGGNITLTLPQLVEGRMLIAKKMDSSGNSVTLSGTANIDGAASKSTTTQYASFTLVGGVTEWMII